MSICLLKRKNWYSRQSIWSNVLGPNGAGKTTTINLLTGQAAMGVVPDESNLYEDLDGFRTASGRGTRPNPAKR